MRRFPSWLIVLTLICSLPSGVARADEPTLSKAIDAAVAAVPGWVLSAERARSATQVLVVDAEGTVQLVEVSTADGAVTGQEQYGGKRAVKYAEKVRAAGDGAPPDLAALTRLAEKMARGCQVVEAELETHQAGVLAEIECRLDDIEVELVFDAKSGAVVGLEVEREGSEDDEDDENDEDDEDDEDEIENGTPD